jgi:hypothetical protein
MTTEKTSLLVKVIRKDRPSQQLFKAFIVFYTSTATCFGFHWPSSGETHNIYIYIYKDVIILTTDHCLLYKLCCARYLTSAVMAYLNVIARYLLVHAVASFFNIRCWKCGC